MKAHLNLISKSILIAVAILSLVIINYKFTEEILAAGVNYDVVDNSESTLIIPNMTVKMKEGTITVIATSKAAAPSTTIRYETLGFGVSTSKAKSKSLKINGVNYNGYSAPNNVGIFWMNDAHKIKSETVDGWNTSTFEFKAKEVNRILGDKLSNITNDTKIYLNAVFRSYELTSSGKVTRKNNISTWTDMMHAEYWSRGSLEGFAKYYNLELIFSPGKQPSSLYYKLGGTEIFQSHLDHRYINDLLEWEDKVYNTIGQRGTTYYLIGYEVRTKLHNRIIAAQNYDGKDGEYIYDMVTSNAQARVPLGGLDIIIKYTDKPTIPPINIPEEDVKQKHLDKLYANGSIRGDKRDAEKFNATYAIPTTESLYSQVYATEYSTGYQFNKKVVVKEYPVTVSKKFILTWTDGRNGKERTQDVVVKQSVPVQRACAYWEIVYFDYFTIEKASLDNKVLPNGSCTIYPNTSYYQTPHLVLNKNRDENYHIVPPPQTKSGAEIVLETERIRGEREKPNIPIQDFTYEANMITEECKVRSDYLSFGGVVIMDNKLYEKEAPPPNRIGDLDPVTIKTHKNALYKPNLIIEPTLQNNTYHSSGTLKYKNNPSAVKSSGNYYNVSITGINQVTIHTPVICDASLLTENEATNVASNNTYVQAINVDHDCVQLVLDPEGILSDFTVVINNYGSHISNSGYNTRDFAWSLRDSNVSYIAKKNNIQRNEVKFPFDVFYRNPNGEDKFIKKNTWIRVGHNTPTFYLPMWVDEGIYTVDFRTVAVNGEEQLENTQTYANTMSSNYVATDSIRVQVSGRLYGLTIYDVTDYPTWETVFREEKETSRLKINGDYPSGAGKEVFNSSFSYDYTVGIADQYGNKTERLRKFTLPLVNGSHPKISNVGLLKPGYGVKFKLTSIGNNFNPGDSVLIKPRFYHVDSQGNNRKEVDIYYNEKFNNKNNLLVKVGSTLDQTNIKSYNCGNNYIGIPDYNLNIMAQLNGESLEKYKWRRSQLFTYSSIKIQSPLMVYTNTDYLRSLKNMNQYNKVKSEGIKEEDIVNRMQTFYAEYYLPADIMAVEKGYDVYDYAARYGISGAEDLWLQEGFIIVNFDIVTVDSQGNMNLSYINQDNVAHGYCSMWDMEQPLQHKISSNGRRIKPTKFNLHPGDFMIYYINKSIRDDYESYVIE